MGLILIKTTAAVGVFMLHLMPNIIWSIEVSLPPGECKVKGDAWRFDCLPRGIVSKRDCLARGCCWKPPDDPLPPSDSGIKIPQCYFPNGLATYNVTTTNPSEAGGFQVKATLQRASGYPRDVKNLVANFLHVDENILRIRILDADHKRWEVPGKPPQRQFYKFQGHSRPSTEANYIIKVPKPGSGFGFQVLRKNGKFLLKTAGAFLFSDQFLQLSTLIPSPLVYGLGEHRSKLMVNASWTQATLWNDGHVPQENANLYGSHPFILCGDVLSDWFGVFLHNSNAMDVIIQPAPAVTWRPIGGIIDMYIMTGPSPSDVVSQYMSIVGRPTLPPYWALGFHLCWQQYGTANATLNTAHRMRRFGIPQDVQWNDIDYAYKSRVFTLNPDGFGDQASLCQGLHTWGLHYVIMADCGIYSQAERGTYEAYDLGVEADVFIKDARGDYLEGKVWPGRTVWPDFLSDKSQEYWTKVVKDFHHKVAFDGLWVDMNEITSFTDGSIHGCPYNSSLDFPPYCPAVRRGALYRHTLCPSARHSISSHYNVHNLYGLYDNIRTATALQAIRQKRPFVISRSTFPGQGQYGGHWSGDNKASWYDMYKSVAAMLHMNMYGIPMTGSDICGFFLNATEELCTRWHQLGAFYVFSRNHHSDNTVRQDPTAFGQASARSSRKALLTRYSLLPYLYTLLWQSHMEGTTVARPLFWAFPGDKQTLDLDSQFMWGPWLMISPVLKQGERHVVAYFPKDTWYDFYTGERLRSPGQFYRLPAPLDVINLHVRGGAVLPMQQPAQTTALSRKLPFWLLVALDNSGSATGQIFWDDGDSIVENSYEKYNFIQFQAFKTRVWSIVRHVGFRTEEQMLLGNVTVMGVEDRPSSVWLDGRPIAFSFRNMVLYMTSMRIDLTRPFFIQWR